MGHWDGLEDKGMRTFSKLVWNVVDDSTVLEKLVLNGLFGYVAVDFAKECGKRHGMHGSSIVMAIPGGNYTANHG